METTVIEGAQVRSARRLLRWRVWKLAQRAGVSPALVRRAEKTSGHPPLTGLDALAIRKALEAAGLEFTKDPPGVKLRAD